ncbi:MAG: IS1595 family transposase, partial [Dehalococcoidia bacterium]|nr:IS1595 family transposase [Dehalococcoidia bacterium]
MSSAPGKSHRQGLSIIQLMDMFPDEESARDWFEANRWPDHVTCPRCQSDRVSTSNGSMSHWCAACRRRFSVRTGTVMERSKIPLRKWAIAIYMVVTNLKGVSSMKLHRELNVTQKTAWFLLHRIREAMNAEVPLFTGPVEVDEMYVGGIETNKHASKRTHRGGGGV